jgi:putrescine transport system permease protein
MTLVFVFLYLPIVTLIVLSFNASPMVTSWGGWSLRWYAALAKDAEIIAGFKLSLEIAFLTACASVILGTLAAIALSRFKRFPGRTLFAGMVNSPLVMPEVIIGLSLLLMLVSVQRAFGFPDRGLLTIWFGHTLLGMAYATVVVQSRLQEMSPQFEEAAQDLGCRPWQVFFLVTLPLISQAIGSAWLLTFTLSLDDVVLSAFLSGPGSTTMPITIFSRARLGLSPSVNTVATLTVAVVSVGVVLASVWLSRAERRRAQEMSAAFRGAGG